MAGHRHRRADINLLTAAARPKWRACSCSMFHLTWNQLSSLAEALLVPLDDSLGCPLGPCFDDQFP